MQNDSDSICNLCRFPVAIKNPQHFGYQEMLIFLEEIKSMLEIDRYHENIVNLQGIVYGKEDVSKGLPKVYFCFLNLFSIMVLYPFLYYH